ncbi:MAG TPA: serine/threonine-protein kinase [Ramlibacter sp.]|nr:serine/threonine-protein kinase [Ramlibacter sp.]
MSLKKLGRYELIRVLGKGAMGIVYEGKDPNLDRRVAIKTVKVENLSEEAAAEYEHRFRTEARSAARLQHPNIVSVYDSDRDGDIAFLVMEYIQGDDLKHHLDKGVRYSLEQCLKMIRDLLSALDYAHKQGIVHRDIKPANLLIEPGGRVKLTDFGVARIQDSGEATRTQGSMVGTLKYMAPEQVQGQKIDSRADLFSVGVVLYQLLTDKRPFDGDNDFSIIHQIIGHNPPSPSSINDKLPSAIDAVVARALAKSRDERFGSARDFATALQSAIRRAEDQTIVPPANPQKKPDTGGTGSRAGQSIAGAVTSPSTVTQEVELVYWKDIKDSAEADEFEAFLDKFPAGIYADLARKRLRKLQGAGNGSGDQTMLSGMATAGGANRDVEPDEEATRLRTGTMPSMVAPVTAPVPAAPVPAPAPAPAPVPVPAPVVAAEATTPEAASAKGPVSDFPSTIAFVHPSVLPATTPAPTAAPAVARPVERKAKEEKPKAPARAKAPAAAGSSGKKPPIAVLAGVGAVIVVGIAAFLMSGRGASAPDASLAGQPPASAAASAAAAPAPEPAAEPSTHVVAPAVSAPVAASEAKSAGSVAKAAPSRPAPPKVAASKAKVVAPAAVAEPARPAPAPQVQQEAPKPAPAPSASRAELAAADACKDKSFISREFCLSETCEKPGARGHPLCVEWRAQKRLRESSRIGN